VPTPDAAAIAATALLAVLAGFQVLLATGRPWGRFAWGGRPLLLLDAAGVVGTGLPAGVVSTGTWVVTGYFALGVLVNLASRSRSERAVMTPTVAVLFALALAVALG
jgi:hypothetical protein